MAAPSAFAQGFVSEPEVELEDVITIEVLGRDLLAYDLLGTGRPSVHLEVGEQIVWMKASGRIGVAVTDRRLLGVSVNGGNWQEVRYGVHETAPERAMLGKRVALVVTDRRALGYDSRSGIWITEEIGPNERVEVARVGDSTALVVTDRKSYGLSPDTGGFYGIPMTIHEQVQSVSVKSNAATVSTSQRLLVFRAPTGAWSVERRPLH
jgi:predicted RNA-binding protein